MSSPSKTGADLVDEAGNTSSDNTDDDDCENSPNDSFVAAGAEASIAVDPIHDVKPVKALQALRAQKRSTFARIDTACCILPTV